MRKKNYKLPNYGYAPTINPTPLHQDQNVARSPAILPPYGVGNMDKNCRATWIGIYMKLKRKKNRFLVGKFLFLERD